jgi:hypothetical protein
MNTDADNGVDRLQVDGGIYATGPVSSGTFTARGRFGSTALNVPRADMTFNASYNGSAWVRDDDTKSSAIFTMNDGLSDIFVAPAAAGNITWTHAFRVYPTGDVYIPKRHQQINFSLYDPNVALAAQTVPGVWRAEYGAATVVQVACAADTADAVIQIKKGGGGTNVLASNLTCVNSGWATTTSFANSILDAGDDWGLQIISGTAKRIHVSITYTGN